MNYASGDVFEKNYAQDLCDTKMSSARRACLESQPFMHALK